MPTQAMPGVPAGGLKTVGQVHATNDLLFSRTQNAMGWWWSYCQRIRLVRLWWMIVERSSGSSESSMYSGHMKRARISTGSRRSRSWSRTAFP
ncbi:MAG: hypothetical protein EWM72_00674 [Nitrospira sp.]|nr:MAG: hypothetical protein EWM72_00674 [Nitrospira sp.]